MRCKNLGFVDVKVQLTSSFSLKEMFLKNYLVCAEIHFIHQVLFSKIHLFLH